MLVCTAERRKHPDAEDVGNSARGPGLLVPVMKASHQATSALVTNEACNFRQQNPPKLALQDNTSPSSSDDSSSSCTQLITTTAVNCNNSNVAASPTTAQGCTLSSTLQTLPRAGVAPTLQQHTTLVHQQRRVLLSAVPQLQQLQQVSRSQNASTSGITLPVSDQVHPGHQQRQEAAAPAVAQKQQQHTSGQPPGQLGDSRSIMPQAQQQSPVIQVSLTHLNHHQQLQQIMTGTTQLPQKRIYALLQQQDAVCSAAQQSQQHLIYNASQRLMPGLPTGASAQPLRHQQRFVMPNTTGVTQGKQQQQQPNVVLVSNSKHAWQTTRVPGQLNGAAVAAAELAVVAGASAPVLPVCEPLAKRLKLTPQQQQQHTQPRLSPDTAVPQQLQKVASDAVVGVQPALPIAQQSSSAVVPVDVSCKSVKTRVDAAAAITAQSCQPDCVTPHVKSTAAAQQLPSQPTMAATNATSIIADIRRRLVLQECAKHLGVSAAAAAAAAGSSTGQEPACGPGCPEMAAAAPKATGVSSTYNTPVSSNANLLGQCTPTLTWKQQQQQQQQVRSEDTVDQSVPAATLQLPLDVSGKPTGMMVGTQSAASAPSGPTASPTSAAVTEHDGTRQQQQVAAVSVVQEPTCYHHHQQQQQQQAQQQKAQQQQQAFLHSPDGVAGNLVCQAVLPPAAAAYQAGSPAKDFMLKHADNSLSAQAAAYAAAMQPAAVKNAAANTNVLAGNSLGVLLQQQQQQLLVQRQCLVQQQLLLRQHLQHMPQLPEPPNATASVVLAAGCGFVTAESMMQAPAVTAATRQLQQQHLFLQKQELHHQSLPVLLTAVSHGGDSGTKEGQQLLSSQQTLCQQLELKLPPRPDQLPPKYMQLQHQGYRQRRRAAQSWSWLQSLGNTAVEGLTHLQQRRRHRCQSSKQQRCLVEPSLDAELQQRKPKLVVAQELKQGGLDMAVCHSVAELKAAELLVALSGL